MPVRPGHGGLLIGAEPGDHTARALVDDIDAGQHPAGKHQPDDDADALGIGFARPPAFAALSAVAAPAAAAEEPLEALT